MKVEEIKQVNVTFPDFKLTISDLSYLRTLATNTGCIGSTKSRDKLVFLGLVEYKEIPPCPKALQKYEEQKEDLLNGIREEFDSGEPLDVNKIGRLGYELRYLREPQAQLGYVVTEAGKKLLQEGIVETKISKKGCA